MADKVQFFKVRPEHKDPEIPWCSNADDLDCLGQANPAWRLNDVVFCAVCAPLELKNPEKHLKDQARDHSVI